MVDRPPKLNAAEMTAEDRKCVKRAFALTTEDEVNEPLTMMGLVTVGISNLRWAARTASHRLIVAKVIINAIRILETQLRDVVPIRRDRGSSWTQIRAALGMTKQSAWERFSGED